MINLQTENLYINTYSMLDTSVSNNNGKYFLDKNYIRVIVVQSRAISPSGIIYSNLCPRCRT